MNQRAVAAVADAIVPIIAEAIGEFLKPMLGRMAELEEQINALSSRPVEPGRPGKDADPALIVSAVDEAIAKALPVVIAEAAAAVPPGKPGNDIDPAEVYAEITRQVSALPPPVPGRDADPAEVISAASAAVRELLPAMLEPALASHGSALAERCDSLERRLAEVSERDPTESVDWEAMNQRVDEAIQKTFAALPEPKKGEPGVGITDGLVDMNGHLIVTFSDGRTKDVGRVVDPEANRAAIDRYIEAKFEALPKPKDGEDGFGLEDFEVDYDGERTVTIRFVRGDLVKEKAIKFPVVLERGVFSPDKAYERSDGVTYGGSFWIAQCDNPDGKPGDVNSDWRLSVKRGRNGKDVAAIKPPPQGPVKSGQ